MDKNKGGRPKEASYYARLRQNYRVKRQVCGNCMHFRFSREPAEWAVKMYPDDIERQKASAVDKGLRCALGQFPVKRSATCDEWSLTLEDTLRVTLDVDSEGDE